eukprot:CAMPEP_0198696036 /NCGR_PEP_ID=MMETSP1468-20131203/298539_1 /TAXON_ID=1461545 /ORGANISM="Mantoniella sp, Strain CCMP1436" /LENGTH=51 /DNA_ID=CAMNT_0044452055 /DNA_START=414 /DNA_END=569 /DNA_ORIENTATION=+
MTVAFTTHPVAPGDDPIQNLNEVAGVDAVWSGSNASARPVSSPTMASWVLK